MTIRSVPLLAFVVVAYNVRVLMAGAGVQNAAFSVQLPSRATWTMPLGDLLVAIGLFLLYLEILKATRTTAAAVIDHALSMLVFIFCLVEFLLIERMATASFFLIMVMTFIDVISGFTVTISTARRDIGVGDRIH